MNRLSGYSTTGVWVLESGDRLIGPFDGLTPARAERSRLADAGVESTLRRVFAPSEAREAVEVRGPGQPLRPPRRRRRVRFDSGLAYDADSVTRLPGGLPQWSDG